MSEKFGDLNLTQDELKRFSEAMKKEEFRKMLIDYAEEISDPKNRELYETEITKLENERGMNVIFIHPEPGFCIKTTQTPANHSTSSSSSSSNLIRKCFINICKNVNVEKPTCSRTNTNTDKSGEIGKPGMYWSIPHTCTPPREDYDNKKTKCEVYDVVFHPDAYRMGETNQRFNMLLRDTALSTVEKNFNVKLDRANLKVLKNLNFKGRPVAATIKKPLTPDEAMARNEADKKTETNDDDVSPPTNDTISPLIDQLKEQYYENQKKTSRIIPPVKKTPEPVKTTPAVNTNEAQYTEPVYTCVHRGQVDFQDCANQLDNLNGSRQVGSTRPKELFISIQLPLCKSSENVTLDIFEKSLHLESTNPNYKLNLNLPYPINENESKAKFDKSKRCLNLTLQVVPFVAQVELTNSHIEMVEDNEIDNTFSPSSSSLSSSVSSLECTNSSSLSPTPTKSNTEIKYNLPNQCSIKEFKNKLVLRVNVFNYDKSSIRLHVDSESAFNVTCESLSSSGTYIQYYAAYVRFYYVKCLERQRKPLSIYDSDLNAYNCIEKLSNFEISHVDDDSFEIKLNRNVKEIEQDFNDIKIKKACIALKEIKLDDIEDLSISGGGNDCNANFMIIDVNQDCVNENENVNVNDLSKVANGMSKKEFMLNFSAISNSEHLDEDDDDDDAGGSNEKKESKSLKKGKIIILDLILFYKLIPTKR
jgi:dynein assembly factor 2, axonemal